MSTKDAAAWLKVAAYGPTTHHVRMTPEHCKWLQSLLVLVTKGPNNYLVITIPYRDDDTTDHLHNFVHCGEK